MTATQKLLVDKLSRYFANVDEYNYKKIIKTQIRDKDYENLLLSMTIDRIPGRSGMKKYSYENKYNYVESTKRNK